MIHAWPRGNCVYGTAGKYPHIPPAALGCCPTSRLNKPQDHSSLPWHWKWGTLKGSHQVLTHLQWGQGPCVVQSLFNVINCGLCVKAGPAGATWSALSQLLTVSFYTCNVPEHPAESLEKAPFKNLTFQQHFQPGKASSAQVWSRRAP